MALLGGMLKASLTRNVISFNEAISACEKEGQWELCIQWEEALALFREMREARVMSNVISFNAAISACEEGGRWDGALAW